MRKNKNGERRGVGGAGKRRETVGRGHRFRRAHLDEQREARVHGALQDGVAGGPYIQRVSTALCHGAHRAKILRDLGRREQRRRQVSTGQARGRGWRRHAKERRV